MRDSQTQEFVGIDWSVIDPDFVVQVRSGTATAQPDVSDGIAPAHVLSGDDRIAGKVTVARRDSVAVVKRDGPSISTHEVSKHHDAISGSYHRLPVGGRYIDSTME